MNLPPDIEKEITLYTSWIVHDIRSPNRRRQVKKEYSAHLEDAVYHHMMSGCTDKEAFRIAQRELGNAEDLQRILGIVHNKATLKQQKALLLVCLILITACAPSLIPHLHLASSWQSWLILLSQFLCAIASVVFVTRSYAYIRALVKRILLLHRIKKICKEKGYRFHCTRKAYTECDGTSSVPPLIIETAEKTYAIRFIACLKRKDTYTFTDVNSYFTSNNFNPILLSLKHPISGVTVPARFLLPRIAKLKNNYVKDEVTHLPSERVRLTHAEQILCIHPISVKVQVVHTNRAETVFDGDTFKGHTVYSGNGLCARLKST